MGTPVNCNDSDLCTTDTCDPVTGCVYTPISCDDGVSCTVDTCNSATGCVYTPDDANCQDNGVYCDGDEVCDPINGCISTGNPCTAGAVCNESNDSCDQQAGLTVKVDIKPGSCPNSLNPRSEGVVSVAILGSKNFSVKDIDPATIMIGREGTGGVKPIRYSYADVAAPYQGGKTCGCTDKCGDGYKDLVLKFDTEELVDTLQLDEAAGQTVPLIVTGSLKANKGGTSFSGQDCLQVLKIKQWHKKEICFKFRGKEYCFDYWVYY